MSAHEQRLLAAGIDPQTARRDAWADSLQWLNNREREAAQYAMEQSDAGINFSDGFSMKYGAACGAD